MSNFRKPRQYVATISIRHKDMLLVESVTGGMKKWLETSKDIDQTLPNFVGLNSLDNHSCNLSVMVSSNYQYSGYLLPQLPRLVPQPIVQMSFVRHGIGNESREAR